MAKVEHPVVHGVTIKAHWCENAYIPAFAHLEDRERRKLSVMHVIIQMEAQGQRYVDKIRKLPGFGVPSALDDYDEKMKKDFCLVSLVDEDIRAGWVHKGTTPDIHKRICDFWRQRREVEESNARKTAGQPLLVLPVMPRELRPYSISAARYDQEEEQLVKEPHKPLIPIFL